MWREGDGQGGRRDRSRDEYSGYSGARGPRAARDPCSGCVARERARRSRPLSSRVSTAVRGVVFAVSRGTLGLVVGGPIRSEMDRACTVGDAAAPGWSRASLVDATVRC